MYSYYTRASNVFYFAVWTLAAMAIFCAITVEFYSHPGVCKELKFNRMIRFKPIDMYDVGEETDSAYFTMNLKYDLSGEWNWNVRSLYAYVILDYVTPGYKRQEMIVWDKIIMDPSKSTFKGKNIGIDYLPKDIGRNLRGVTANLTFAYDVQPFFGRQKIFKSPVVATFTFPEEYTK